MRKHRSPGSSPQRPNAARDWSLAVAPLPSSPVFLLVFPDKRGALLGGSLGFLKGGRAYPAGRLHPHGPVRSLRLAGLRDESPGEIRRLEGELCSPSAWASLPTGPLYAAFPMAAALREKGARSANIFLFLTAWACIKLPQELLELRFLGPRFMLTRLALTIVLAVPSALLVERFVEREAGAAGGNLPDI